MTNRGGGNEERGFQRSYASLDEIFRFLEDFFTRAGIDRRHLNAVGLAVEELFTNMVKYNPGNKHEILIQLSRRERELAVRLTDFDVDAFDITQAKEVDVHRPIEERRPGGLGVHLVKKLVDRIEYEYVDRTSRTTIVKALD